MKNSPQNRLQIWSILILLALALLTLAFQGGDEVNPAHCRPCATRTPTSRPTPQLQPCRVSQISFNKQPYQPGATFTVSAGSPLKVTVWVVDAQGAPLPGANVDVVVTLPETGVQTAGEPISLPDQSGAYEGFFTPDIVGSYTLQFLASDAAGQRFLPCSAQAVLTVDPPILPSPTTVRVNPTRLQTTLCSLRDTSNVVIENINNLAAVQLELLYDPSVIQVIDANRTQRGVQVKIDPSFVVESLSRNEVDTVRGHIFFSANLPAGQTINGNVIAIDWRPQRVGNSAISLKRVDLTNSAGQPMAATLQDGAVQVNFVPDCRTGTAALQGRADYSGVIVTNEAGQKIQTEADGYFALTAREQLRLTYPGYLAGRADLYGLEVSQVEGKATQLGVISLLAGDVNGDQRIDILDLAYLARRFSSTDAAADLNADGRVDILDLALVAGNYGQ